MSTLPRISRFFPALALAISLSGCDFSAEKEASRRVGEQPKKTLDKVTTDVNKAMQQQGQDSERLKEDQK